MNADVEKAVGLFERHGYGVNTAWQTIRQALRDQDAEIERLRNISDGNAELYQHEVLRSENADALLRECRQMLPDYCEKLVSRITAHLGGEHER